MSIDCCCMCFIFVMKSLAAAACTRWVQLPCAVLLRVWWRLSRCCCGQCDARGDATDYITGSCDLPTHDVCCMRCCKTCATLVAGPLRQERTRWGWRCWDMRTPILPAHKTTGKKLVNLSLLYFFGCGYTKADLPLLSHAIYFFLSYHTRCKTSLLILFKKFLSANVTIAQSSRDYMIPQEWH